MKRAVAFMWLAIFAAPMAGAQTSGAYTTLDSIRPPLSLAVPVSLDLRDVAIRDVMNEVARQAHVSIVFEPSLPGMELRVTVRAEDVPGAKIIMRVLVSTPIQAMVSAAGTVVLTAKHRMSEETTVVMGETRSTLPLGGVHVQLRGTRFEATSNESGQFNLGRVPPGVYRLAAMHIGFEPVDRAVTIAAGEPKLDIAMIPIAIPLAAVIVTPGYFGMMQTQVTSSQALTRPQIETVPQIGEDVYRAIGRLPGVATTDFSAKFAVRGEPGDELLVTLDGLPLVEPFHLKDMGDALSIVDLASLGGAELMTGGASAEYGDQLAGVFQLHTLYPRVDRARTSVGVSLTNFRGMTQGGFASGKGGWLVSGRRGFLDLAFKIANLADSIYPRYNDVFGKVTYALPHNGGIALHALHATDVLRYQDAREPRLNSKYFSDYVWATVTAQPAARVHHESVLWLGSLDWQRVGDGADLNREFPSVHVVDTRGLHTLGIKQDWSVEMGERALFKFGGDLRRERASYNYLRRIQRQVVQDHAFVTLLDSAKIDLAPTNDVVEAYVAERLRPVDALTLEAGVRYDRADATNDAVLGPRINAAWEATSRSTLRFSWGDYSQRQSIFALQVQDGVQTFSAAERAKQVVVGWDQMVGRGLVGRVEAYSRRLSNMRPRYANATTAIAVFPEIAYDRVYLAPSDGRSQGVELSLSRPSGSRVDWSASYVISSATEMLRGTRVPRANDQPHAVHLDWSTHPTSNKWRLTVSAMWHSGWPYTPDSVRIDTVGTTASTQYAHATWSAGTLHSGRLPAYQRIDARWTRFFDTRTGRVSLFVDIYNVLNTMNVRDIYTNVNINQLSVRYIDRSREQLPRIPSFGINWEF